MKFKVFLNMKTCIGAVALIILLMGSITYEKIAPVLNTMTVDEELNGLLQAVFDGRNKGILDNDPKVIEAYYDKNTKYGTWAYEYEVKKMKYLHTWSEKQGIKFIGIKTRLIVRRSDRKEQRYSVNLLATTEYKYVYEDKPDEENTFRIGTYHSIALENKDESWNIVKEWYTDPFMDSLNLDNIKNEEIKTFINAQSPRDFSKINERRIASVEYAEKFCGAAAEEKYSYKYNSKYRDFNPQGGDCANFASQILFEGGKFKKNKTWNYNKGDGTAAWLNAYKFKEYWLNSGRASLIGYGTYNKIYKLSYKLLPGDIVAYEKKGDVCHVATVTGADSKGYALVTCHNTDRSKVPWDLGWSNKNIKFWLIRVHY